MAHPLKKNDPGPADDLTRLMPLWRPNTHRSGERVVEMRVMRKRFRVLLLAAIVAAFIVPVGFALSLDPSPRVHTAATAGVVPVMFVAGHSSFDALLQPLPDAAKLLLVGTTLFGLAAAVRKTN